MTTTKGKNDEHYEVETRNAVRVGWNQIPNEVGWNRDQQTDSIDVAIELYSKRFIDTSENPF